MGYDDATMERYLTRWADWDPLAQFSERSELIFQEAMNREMNDLAEQMGRLRISDPDRIARQYIWFSDVGRWVEQVD